MANRANELQYAILAGDIAALDGFTVSELETIPLDKHGNVALAIATEYGSHAIIRHLITQCRVNIEAPINERQWRPLCLAMVAAKPDTVRLLLKLGADARAPTGPALQTCVHHAARAGRDDNLCALFEAVGPVQARALVNLPAAEGVLPLFMSALHNRASASRVLIGAGADPKLLSPRGNNALHYLAASAAPYHVKSAHWQLLASSGVDEKHISLRQLTPWEKQYQGQCDAFIEEAQNGNLHVTIPNGAERAHVINAIVGVLQQYNGENPFMQKLARRARGPFDFYEGLNEERYGELEEVHYTVLHVARRLMQGSLQANLAEDNFEAMQAD